MSFSSNTVTIKLCVAVVTGVLLLLPVMLSKPLQCVRCGLPVTNTQVRRDRNTLFKDEKIKGFSFLSHGGKISKELQHGRKTRVKADCLLKTVRQMKPLWTINALRPLS